MMRPTSHRLRSLAAVTLSAVAAGCGGKGVEPPSPTGIVATSANPLTSVAVGSAIATAPTFEVHDEKGRAMSGVLVTVAVTAGGGSLTGAPTVTLAGPTPIGNWTLGNTSGAQSVTVSVPDVTPLVFNITALAGPATQFAIVDGDDQFGTQNAATFAPLRVRARDQFNNPVAGMAVTWNVDAGGGSLAGGAAPVTQTGADGIAVAPTWTLGASANGEQAVVATMGALSQRFTATAQNAPASLVVEIAAPASATVATAINPQPAFTVRDAGNVPLQGIPVTIAITAGNGTLGAAPTVTALGVTPIGNWTLGTTAGTQTVTITAPGLPAQALVVTSTPGAPASLTILQGNNQTVPAGAPVPVNPKVKLTDAFANGISGQPVTWSVSTGGGTLGGAATVNTDANGNADATGWTLGKRGGAQQLVATAGALAAQFAATIETAFTIDLRYSGTPPSAAVQQAFSDAKARVEAMVVGDLLNVQIRGNTANSPFNLADCGNPSVTGSINEIVDDVVIYAGVVPIDGVGQVLGAAGPCLTRSTGGLTALGTMRFDSADLDDLAARGRLLDVITHEMLHVVGMGTLWATKGLLTDSATTTPKVVGALATAACVNDHAGGGVCPNYVPAENCLDLTQSCGVGTRLSHWKESTFRTELMTGYAGATNPLSKMTVQGLADLGYGVNLLVAEPYTVPPPALMALLVMEGDAGPAEAEIRLPPPLRPRFRVEASGRLRPIAY